MPRCPLQENPSLHFTDADDADRGQSTELFDSIEDILKSEATQEFTEKIKLSIVRDTCRDPHAGSHPLAESLLYLPEIRTLLVTT
jgi:hypothetical protein